MDGLLIALFNIIVIDLTLSGDNAVVIGMAVRKLPPRQKRVAILAGGGLAIALRIALTAVATFLLTVPLLRAVGGLVLLWITYHLITADDDSGHTTNVEGNSHLWDAMRTIIIADVTMSTDNVLAVGAAAHGDIPLLIFGLTLSMAILVMGGTIVSVLMSKIGWLVYVGAGVLVVLAGEMIASDTWLLERGWLPEEGWVPWALTAAGAVLVVAAIVLKRRRRDRARHAMQHAAALAVEPDTVDARTLPGAPLS
ncbi:MAG TPA: TerC family protein [Chloroflexia bacterium]|nr:TerC family protein [Chloroflexia bacterium]